MDYVTTAVALNYCKLMGPEYRLAPIWKCTRLGKFLVRHGLVSAPTMQEVKWYDHELNPIGKWLLKYGGGIPSLAWFKTVVLLHIAHSVKGLPVVEVSVLTKAFAILSLIYVVVVINNLYAIRRMERTAHKVRVKKRAKVDFEDPLLPI